MPASICQCDKLLAPLSTCPTYFNSFYPLQLFFPFHMYSNLPIHKYPSSIFVEQPTNISPVFLSSSLPLTLLLSPFPSLFAPTFSPTFNLFLYLYLSLSLSLCLSLSFYPV